MTVVTDDQVAALRAQLAGQGDEHRRLLNRLDPEAANIGYTALVTGAFFEAVRRRFLKDGKPADDAEIIDFVSSVRLRLEEEEDRLDPNVAEIMIKVALGKLPVEARKDISGDVGYRSQILLVAGLVGDAQLTSDELDDFLRKARFFADELRS
ncbi:hypothetical protein [Actinomadura chibensis]|uniref:Uncharacterized protein n=1 Tax=Actinomadura chibensis TaxID=392828 RepID=A0A5D0NPU4_9ACTN|nr:hypothetical protein [Actinomadura chibensis]TYB46630.1 hypothetical protein FXF69_15555 [Actinomadura chibensis]